MESIRIFENSLRDYLIDTQSDSYNEQNKIRHVYNNLKVCMDPKKFSTPHFIVSVGISSACYSLETLEKLDGSMGNHERFILRWASRPNINGELKKHWAYITQSSEIMTNQVANEKQVEESLESLKSEIKDAAESVTGSGVLKRNLYE